MDSKDQGTEDNPQGLSISTRDNRNRPKVYPTHEVACAKEAIANAPNRSKTAEFHLQILKYADLFKNMSAKECSEELGLTEGFATEVGKMRAIFERLVKAGLDPSKI